VEVCYYATSSEDVINREFEKMTESLNKKLDSINLEVDRIEKTTRFFHFEKTAKENPMIDSLISAAKKSTGRTLTPIGACQSDLSMFLHYGSKKAISFGSGRPFGVYGGAHQSDEYIECDALLEFSEILGQLLAEEIK
jgi:acetylornithine deacetylase/succinyl-diaminopimelate desuccinylase-like protein